MKKNDNKHDKPRHTTDIEIIEMQLDFLVQQALKKEHERKFGVLCTCKECREGRWIDHRKK